MLAIGHGYRVTVNGPEATPTAADATNAMNAMNAMNVMNVMNATNGVTTDVTNEEMAEAVAEARRTTK